MIFTRRGVFPKTIVATITWRTNYVNWLATKVLGNTPQFCHFVGFKKCRVYTDLVWDSYVEDEDM